MSSEYGCTEVRALAPELALGIASGNDRARALVHLAECGDCRAHVASLAAVADDMLLLAPSAEPPAGFESRVLDRMGPARRKRPRWRPFALAGLAAATAGVTALVMVAGFQGDRRDASAYRAALAHAHGASFKAVALRDPSGARAGQVFAYQGPSSWMYVTVAHRGSAAGYRCTLVTRDGRRIEMYNFAPDARTGSWGGATPVPLRDVRAVEVSTGTGGRVLTAQL